MENIFKNENIGVIDILERILDVVYPQLCGIQSGKQCQNDSRQQREGGACP